MRTNGFVAKLTSWKGRRNETFTGEDPDAGSQADELGEREKAACIPRL
jgi:hypothetical protein